MDLIGRVFYYGRGGSQINQHKYVVIAYSQADKMYLAVNFTTKRGSIVPAFTIEVKKQEFPQVLTSDVSTIEYAKAEELTAETIIDAPIKKDNYGRDVVCPKPLLQRIVAQIDAGSSLKDNLVRKYFPKSPILK